MKKTKQNLYEGMYIINASLSEDARKKALEKISDSIEEKGGKIEKTHDMGKRKLAYQINKKKEGCYYAIYFSLAPNHIAELWKEYHLHEDLIRFMIVRADEVLETLEFAPLNLQTT